MDGLQGEASCTRVQAEGQPRGPPGRSQEAGEPGAAPGEKLKGIHLGGGTQARQKGASGRAEGGRGHSGWAVGGSVQAVGGGGLRLGGGVPVRNSLAGVPQRVAGEGGWQDHTAQETRVWGVLSKGPVGGAGSVPTSLSSYMTTWELFPCVMDTRPRAAKGRNEGAWSWLGPPPCSGLHHQLAQKLGVGPQTH